VKKRIRGDRLKLFFVYCFEQDSRLWYMYSLIKCIFYGFVTSVLIFGGAYQKITDPHTYEDCSSLFKSRKKKITLQIAGIDLSWVCPVGRFH